MRSTLALTVVILLSTVGCGEAERTASVELAAVKAPAGGELLARNRMQQEKDAGRQAPEAVQRKIIYTAQVDLVVEDFEGVENRLQELVKSKKAYIAKSDLQGSRGTRRSGSWTVRVPVESFESFVTELGSLGELVKHSIDSKDVSEEYYDLEARIKNKKVEEERLVKHLEKSTGKLDEILSVERELSRVRGEIESLQGRLQKLSNLTALTTVTISVQERRTYVPASNPSFGTTIGRTFQNSLDGLIGFGRVLVLAVVALTPWIPIILLICTAFWWLAARSRGRTRVPAAPAAVVLKPASPEETA